MPQKFPILSINQLTKNISQIFVQADPSFQYVAGQYALIHHGDFHSPLSIACRPNQNSQLEFHLSHSTKNIEGSHLLLTVKENNWLIEGPLGHSTINHLKKDKPIIFIGHGTGFAPMKAMIEAYALNKSHPAIYLYWSAFRQEDFYLTDLLTSWENALPLQFMLIAGDKVENILALINKNHVVTDYQFYVSGPLKFVQTAYQSLLKQGLTKQDFYSDMV